MKICMVKPSAQELSVLSTEKLIEISVEYIRGDLVKTLMGFHGIVKLMKRKSWMRHIFIRVRMTDADKLLTNTVLPASFAESMIISSFKFRTIIRISATDPIRSLGNDSTDEKASCAVLGFIEKIPATAPWRNHQWPQTDT